MEKKIYEINGFANICGYFYNADIEIGVTCNNGYNCKHPNQELVERGVGKCFAFSCPLARLAYEDDFENKDEYEEDRYVVLESEE